VARSRQTRVQSSEATLWLEQGEERLRILFALCQPMTAGQLGQRLGKSRSSVSEHLRQMLIYEVVTCMNPTALQGRLYWLTDVGLAYQSGFSQSRGHRVETWCPFADWILYGQLIFRHRAAVLRALNGRMRPPRVKKCAFASNPGLRMSVDNCRQVLKWMRDRKVVRSVRPRGKRYLYYELTECGRKYQELHRRVTM